MSWIESHQSLATHRKLIFLRRSLNVRRTCAIGMLHLLWWWCIDNAQDGDLSEIPDEMIADVCDWQNEPNKLVSAMMSAGFIDSDRRIHDWNDYAGKLLQGRVAAKKRMRALRARSKNVPEHSKNVPSTFPVPTVPTVPNPTNPTKPEQGTLIRVPRTMPIPSLAEIKLQCAKIGLPDSEGERFMHYYESNGWRVGKNPMRSWAGALANWKSTWQERNGSRHSVPEANQTQEHITAKVIDINQ